MVSEETKPVLTGQQSGTNLLNIRPPGPLDVADPRKLAENWRLWRQSYEDFVLLTNLQQESRERRLAMFRYSLGEAARNVLNNLTFAPNEDPSDPIAVMTIFERHCLGQANETFERFQFFKRDRKAAESVDQYVMALKDLARSCNFCQCMSDSLLRDRIILGIGDEQTTKRLLKCRQLTLSQCINICRSEEAAELRMRHLDGERIDVDLNSLETGEFVKCSFCGRRHERRKEKCPAWGKTCTKCHKANHFAKECRSIPIKSIEPEEEFALNGVHGSSNSTILWAELLVCGKRRRFQVDSGAAVNIIYIDFVDGKNFQTSTARLRMWNGTLTRPRGKVRLTVINPKNKQELELDFFVVEAETTPILGLQAIQELNFISVNHDYFVHMLEPATAFEKYASVFDSELGCLPGDVNLSVVQGAASVALPVRGVPLALRDALKTELDRLVNIGVITRVDEPTDWVSQMSVALKKTDSLRLCINPNR